jgi:hypothetical protein
MEASGVRLDDLDPGLSEGFLLPKIFSGIPIQEIRGQPAWFRFSRDGGSDTMQIRNPDTFVVGGAIWTLDLVQSMLECR